MVDISKFALYSVTPNNTIGTTTGSNLLGYYTALASASQTAEHGFYDDDFHWLLHLGC